MIMGASWIGIGANAISLLVSARLLGASGRGAYSAILAWALTCASVCDLSLGPALARAIVIGKQPAQFRRFIARAYLGTALTALLVMAVLLNVVLSRTIPDPLGAAIALSAVPALMLAGWGLYFLQATANQVGYAAARMLPACICMVLILVQVPFGLTVDGALAAFAIGFWVVGGWCAVTAWVHLSPHFLRRSDISPTELLRYGIRAHLGTVASVASSRLDLLLLTILVPLAAVGNYALAVSLTTPIGIVGASLGAATFRRIGAGAPNDRALIKSVWRRFLPPTLTLSVAAAGMALLVPHLLGHEFDRAVVPTVLLALGASGLGALYLGVDILQARGMPGTSSLVSLAAAAVSAVTLLMLVPGFGIVGAAISSAATYLIVGTLCVPITLRRAPLQDTVHFPEPAVLDHAG